MFLRSFVKAGSYEQYSKNLRFQRRTRAQEQQDGEAVYDENSSAAPFAEIIVTKNRFGSLGTVYQRFCNGHFVACDQDEARQICTASNAPAARGRRYAQGADV